MERLAADSRRAVAEGDPNRAIGALREALSLWRGQPLADLDDLPEATIVAARLEELAENLSPPAKSVGKETVSLPTVEEALQGLEERLLSSGFAGSSW